MNTSQLWGLALAALCGTLVSLSLWLIRRSKGGDDISGVIAPIVILLGVTGFVVSGAAVWSLRDRTPAEVQQEEAKQRAARMAKLPPGAVVTAEHSPDWWEMEIGGKSYLARWTYRQGNGWVWELIPH